METLNYQTLVHKTKEELYRELLTQVDTLQSPFEHLEEDDEYRILENVEQIVYVLRNCDYEGKK